MINHTVCDLCNSRVPSEVHICPNAWDWRASIQKSRRLKLRRIRDDAETLDWKLFLDLYGRLGLWSHEMGECYTLQCRIIEICGKVIHWRDRRLPPCRCTLASNLAQLQSYAILSQSEFQPWFTFIWFIWFICLKCLRVLVQVRPQAGFYYQLTNGFALEFPYSLIMLPCTIVEWIIRWHIYTWAYSRSESRQPESLAMLSFSPRRSRPRLFFDRGSERFWKIWKWQGQRPNSLCLHITWYPLNAPMWTAQQKRQDTSVMSSFAGNTCDVTTLGECKRLKKGSSPVFPLLTDTVSLLCRCRVSALPHDGCFKGRWILRHLIYSYLAELYSVVQIGVKWGILQLQFSQDIGEISCFIIEGSFFHCRLPSIFVDAMLIIERCYIVCVLALFAPRFTVDCISGRSRCHRRWIGKRLNARDPMRQNCRDDKQKHDMCWSFQTWGLMQWLLLPMKPFGAMGITQRFDVFNKHPKCAIKLSTLRTFIIWGEQNQAQRDFAIFGGESGAKQPSVKTARFLRKLA